MSSVEELVQWCLARTLTGKVSTGRSAWPSQAGCQLDPGAAEQTGKRGLRLVSLFAHETCLAQKR